MTAPKASRQSVAVKRMLYSSDRVREEPEPGPRLELFARDLFFAEALGRRGAADIRVHFDVELAKPPSPLPPRPEGSPFARASRRPRWEL
jgi:hypothetical protein